MVKIIYDFEIHRLQQLAGHSHRHAPEIRNKILLAQIRSDRRGANESDIANRDSAEIEERKARATENPASRRHCLSSREKQISIIVPLLSALSRSDDIDTTGNEKAKRQRPGNPRRKTTDR